jgi:hypothetical protein
MLTRKSYIRTKLTSRNFIRPKAMPKTRETQNAVTWWPHHSTYIYHVVAEKITDYKNSPVIGRSYTRTVCEVQGLALLLRVETLWKCGDGLLFEVPPLASDALLTTFYPPLENVLKTVGHFEISCLGAPFSWLEKPEIAWGEIWIESCVWLGKSGSVEPHTVQITPHAFPTMKMELRGRKFRIDERSAARFLEVGGSL